LTLPPFDLHRPGSLEEASELAERYGDDAAFYCGGTELLLLLKLGFAAFGHLVDLKRVDELRGIRVDDGSLVLGAATTHREIERSPLVLERMAALVRMERRVANVRVRQVGTLGGNLCFSDPHSDPATFLLAAGAEVECRHGGGRARRLPIGDFVVGPYQTALERGEVLVSVRVPLPSPETSIAHAKFAFQERPTATVSSLVTIESRELAKVRIAVGSVGVRPVRARRAEQLLRGASVVDLDPRALKEAGTVAAEEAGPVTDAHGSADYKAHLVGVLLERTLREAAESAAAAR
jgi:aerobic carbon-monoxide dehydrogenase medium subunit